MLSKKQKRSIKLKIKRLKKKLRLWLLPVKQNHYRPVFVGRYSLLAILAIVFGMQLTYNVTQTGSVLGRVTQITSAGLLMYANDARQDSNLEPLVINDKLSLAASAKASDMLEKNYWSHEAPDGTEPWAWLDRVDYEYIEAGENLAKNFSTSSATTTAWMNSQSHRDNILNSKYKEVGYAIAEGDLDGKSTTIVVALYGAPSEKATPSPSSYNTTAGPQGSPIGFASLSPATRVGIAIQSLTPAAATSLALLFMATTVAVTAHAYRRKLPKSLQKSWYRQHGAIKASAMLAVVGLMVLLYGGGQL